MTFILDLVLGWLALALSTVALALPTLGLPVAAGYLLYSGDAALGSACAVCAVLWWATLWSCREWLR